MAADLIALSNDGAHHEVRAVLWDGEPVGQVRLEFQDAGTVELSYWIGRAHWGRGIAGLVVPPYAAAAIGRHAEERIIARVHRDNAASRRVLVKAGMTLVGPTDASPDWLVFEHRA
jgi:RimJ/RimL family protein N-acetyltransferase